MRNTVPESVSEQRLHVVAAVIRNNAGEILIAKRPLKLHQGGLWEFPGGKVEEGEDVQQALVRELKEELAIDVKQFRPLIRIPYDYPDRKVLLDIWSVSSFTGVAIGVEGQEIRWVGSDELGEFQFPAANASIVTAASIPSLYLITPEPGEKSHWSNFLLALEQSIQQGISLVQFRAKSLSEMEYRVLAMDVIALCHKNNARVLLNAAPEIAEQLGADGVHLTSSLLNHLNSRPLPDNKLVAASCHNVYELNKAAAIHCNFAVVGPVNKTASHPGKKGLGWNAMRQLTDSAFLPVYALGGMELKDMEEAWEHGAQGIAAIRSLWKGK